MIQIVSARNVPLRVDITGETGKLSRNNSNKKKSSGFGRGNTGRSRGGLSDEQSGLLDDQNDDLEGADDDILQDKKRVNPFVEVTFQENKVRTTSMEGPVPVWKQSVSLPFNPPHGEFNHSTLEQVTDMLTFTLFDEYIFDDAARGGFLDGEKTQREEKFYLGIIFPSDNKLTFLRELFHPFFNNSCRETNRRNLSFGNSFFQLRLRQSCPASKKINSSGT